MMASFLDQAAAIWKALDEMSERDPEAYRKFISEQMKDGGKLKLLGTTGFPTPTRKPKPPAGPSGSGSRPEITENEKKPSDSALSGAGGPSNSLTDDSFKFPSMLASIANIDADHEQDEGSPPFELKELKLPAAVLASSSSSDSSTKDTKTPPLIQEL